ALHSQILIALWNGLPPAQPAGTAQIVSFKRQGIPVAGSRTVKLLDPAESGPVYHVVTPRLSNHETRGEPFSMQRLYHDRLTPTEGQALYSKIYGEINRFNADVLVHMPGLVKELQTNKGYVLSDADLALLPPGIADTLQYYGIADTLAMHYQTLRRRMLTSMFVLALLGVFAFNLYSNMSITMALIAYPVLMGLAGTLYMVARCGHYQDRHLEYRALAEALRVLIFWRILGVTNGVTDYYLERQRTELEWIRNAIRSVSMYAEGLPPRLPDERQRDMSLVRDRWILDQRKYYQKSTDRRKATSRKLGRWAFIIYSIGMAVAMGLVILDRLVPEMDFWAHQSLVIMVGFAPVLVAVLDSYVDKMAIAEEARQFVQAYSRFQQAAARINESIAAGDVEDARSVALELGQEALREHGAWVMLHRERPLTPSRF
ncbi:MAG TPA: hypothetical protein VD902_00055, partial [Symbiobacteriaceae bacterium]|nr:hypothetical protein [Symbiobacteriaceae bacterium]